MKRILIVTKRILAITTLVAILVACTAFTMHAGRSVVHTVGNAMQVFDQAAWRDYQKAITITTQQWEARKRGERTNPPSNIADYERIIENYPGTEAARYASIQRAWLTSWKNGDRTSAITVEDVDASEYMPLASDIP